jgi:hypothetical protein
MHRRGAESAEKNDMKQLTEKMIGAAIEVHRFAIALEQVVAGTAPEDYRDPQQFFARTCFTRR